MVILAASSRHWRPNLRCSSTTFICAPRDPRHSHVSRWAQPRLVGALPILARPTKCSPAFFLGCARPIPSLGNGLNMASWGDVERGVSPDVRLRPAFYSSDDFRAWPRLGCRGTRTGATKHATRGLLWSVPIPETPRTRTDAHRPALAKE